MGWRSGTSRRERGGAAPVRPGRSARCRWSSVVGTTDRIKCRSRATAALSTSSANRGAEDGAMLFDHGHDLRILAMVERVGGEQRQLAAPDRVEHQWIGTWRERIEMQIAFEAFDERRLHGAAFEQCPRRPRRRFSSAGVRCGKACFSAAGSRILRISNGCRMPSVVAGRAYQRDWCPG